jgi:methionyl-tRNA synthetase
VSDPTPAKDTFFITSAIYYVNDVPHVGHTYEIVSCDLIARYHRLRGERVFFLTGSDEHSQNVVKAAADRGLTPQAWTDQVVPMWQEVWRLIGISYDEWIRTSDPRHVDRVQTFLQRLYDNDQVYLGTYEGPYCISCEEFKAEADLVDGKCPIHLIPVENLSEDNYFFRLSNYQEPLLRLYREQPDFIGPAIRRHEVESFVRSGLRDLSISRAAAVWGVPIPWDSKHTTYVWVDALLNYVTAAGFGADQAQFARLWPADVQMIGKDITRFHAVIWPAMLMAAGLDLPARVFGHGFVNLSGEKMSKSRGNVLAPADLVERIGVDAYRYYFLREVPFGQDGSFSWNSMTARYTSELANGLGNLASRILAMVDSYFEGLVPDPGERRASGRMAEAAEAMAKRFDAAVLDLSLHEAPAALDEFVREANRFLVDAAPWKVARAPARRGELAACLYEALETLRLIAVFAGPIMPGAADRLWTQLGIPRPLDGERLPGAAAWGGMEPGARTRRGESLFPRLEDEDATAGAS